MSAFSVEVAPRARTQLRVIAAWWAEHRRANPTLVADELEALVAELERGTMRGVAYPSSPPARRVLLPRSRYHVYYDVDRSVQVVRILAVWHAARGREPRL